MVQGKTFLKKILYISYDGMTDPLGQSQVLPYLVGLSKEGYQFTILSFEKKDRYDRNRKTIEDITKIAGIDWVPLSFTTRPPVLSKFYDAMRMRRKAYALHRKKHFDMVHCRSYIAADIGLSMKKKFGTKFFFDMRGFWADEKRDGGAWKDNHPVFSRVYKYYKRKEVDYLQHADQIISLTNAGKKELVSWPSFISSVPVTVIPCCADMNLFTVTNTTQKKHGRKILGLPENELVISYLGSVGAWYMLDEMLKLFAHIRKKYPNAIFLFVTHSDKNTILQRLAAHQIPADALKIVEAGRQEVPIYIKASDINVSFIRPVYSKLSSSPTKLGEVLSMGMPVISNNGVGDVEAILREADAGIVFTDFSDAEYDNAVAAIPALLQKDPATIRQKSAHIYSLTEGIDRYSKCYAAILGQ
jgi:glycosyltransferase involved in cell wall biosynthesis